MFGYDFKFIADIGQIKCLKIDVNCDLNFIRENINII